MPLLAKFHRRHQRTGSRRSPKLAVAALRSLIDQGGIVERAAAGSVNGVLILG
jgi:hypothetical protein